MTLFSTSRLRGKCEALLVVDLSASVSSGTTWEVDADGMYCSNDVPLPPSHLHSAYTYKTGQLLKAWDNDTVPRPPRPSPAPAPHWPRPYNHTPTDDVLDSQADHRLRTLFFWLGAAWVKSRAERPSVSVKTTLERCGPFSLVVLSQRRSQVTPLSGHSDQNASETFSNKLQLNKVQSSLRQTSAKTTQVRSKAKTS